MPSVFPAIRPPRSLIELLRRVAERLPDARAFTFVGSEGEETGHLTYGGLDARARAVAAMLQGFRASGERVLLLYPPGLEFISAFFGCVYSAAIAVPVPSPEEDRPRRTLGRLRAVAADARPAFALTTSAGLAFARTAAAEAPELRATRWLATDIVARRLADEWWDPGIRDAGLAYLQYTSGSTSAPKGVMVSHENVLHNSRLISQAWGYNADSTAVMWVPPFHDDGLVHGLIQPLIQSFPSVLMSASTFVQRPYRWLEAITRYRATHSGGPNFAYGLCARKVSPAERGQLDLRSWRVAYNAAEPIRRETLERFVEAFAPHGFRRRALYPAYGLAEATLLVTTKREDADVRFHSLGRAVRDDQSTALHEEGGSPPRRIVVGCGPAVGDTRVVIARPDASCCVPGEEGEVWIAGPSVVKGYWERPAETRETFAAHLTDTGEGPFLRTGDLGFVDGTELFITGRIKDLIIVRGQNHYPQDIEWTVQESHPAVRPGCCAAFSIDAAEEERLVIVAELQSRYTESDSPDLESVAATIRQAVADEHGLYVHALTFLPPATIPKTSSGKIQRHLCRAGFLDGALETLGGRDEHDRTTRSANA